MNFIDILSTMQNFEKGGQFLFADELYINARHMYTCFCIDLNKSKSYFPFGDYFSHTDFE